MTALHSNWLKFDMVILSAVNFVNTMVVFWNNCLHIPHNTDDICPKIHMYLLNLVIMK